VLVNSLLPAYSNGCRVFHRCVGETACIFKTCSQQLLSDVAQLHGLDGEQASRRNCQFAEIATQQKLSVAEKGTFLFDPECDAQNYASICWQK